jgi:hypothetical protein
VPDGIETYGVDNEISDQHVVNYLKDIEDRDKAQMNNGREFEI